MAYAKIEYDEAEFRRLWAEDVPVREIAQRFGAKHGQWASTRARKMGLPAREIPNHRLPRAAICAMYHECGSSVRIAKHFGVSHVTILKILKARGVQVGRRADPLVAVCVRLFRAGLFHRQIAERTGLSEGQVGNRIRSVLGSGPRGMGRFRPRRPA